MNFSVGIQSGELDELRQRLIQDGYDPTPFIYPEPGVRFFCVNSPAGVTVQFYKVRLELKECEVCIEGFFSYSACVDG